MMLDAKLHEDLISYIVSRETPDENGKVKLGDYIIADILRKIIEGDCRVSDMATDHSKNKMFVEFSFYEKDGEEPELE